MTSQINPNNIDGTYPVAGQDNDSQGFRDNFTNIRNNFTFTKAELEDLQNKVVLKSALLNSTLSNDFLGNTALVNPRLTSWRETYFNAGLQSGAYTVLFTNGNFQKITLNGSLILSFSFPSNTQDSYASVKLWISNPSASYILSFPNTMTLGTPGTISGFSGNSITFSTSDISTTTDYFFEVFTFDGGTTYGIRDLTRNRDFSGNNIVFTGSFVANGVVTLGSGASNVVVAATSNSTSTTTGALVVSGGVGIGGNLVVPAGSISTVPLSFAVGATGGNITGVQQGGFAANLGTGATGTASNTLMFSPTNISSSGRALIPVAHYSLLGSNVALNNGSAPALSTSYSIFGGPVAAGTTIGNLMLAAGTTYEFYVQAMIQMASAPTASTIGFTFGGNATTTYYSYDVDSYPVAGTGGLNQGNTSHWYGTTSFPATSSVVLNTQAYTSFAVRARGVVRINAQGTLLPLIQWNTAPTVVATSVQGTYMKFTPLGTQANIVIGNSMGSGFAP